MRVRLGAKFDCAFRSVNSAFKSASRRLGTRAVVRKLHWNETERRAREGTQHVRADGFVFIKFWRYHVVPPLEPSSANVLILPPFLRTVAPAKTIFLKA